MFYLFYSLGRGLGSLLSGLLIGPLGIRNVFRLFAILCGVTGVLYFIVSRLFFREQRKRDLGTVQDIPTEGQIAVCIAEDRQDIVAEKGSEEDAML